MTKTAYSKALLISGLCALVGFVACGGNEDHGNGAGDPAVGGAPATGGASVEGTGGENSAGGDAGTGGSASSQQTSETGGTTGASGGTSNQSGTSATGGSSGTGLQQTCSDVCALMASRSTPLECVPADCVGDCTSTYTKLHNAVAACGNDYMAMLECGVTQPANSWTCFQVSSGVASIDIPVPPSSTATDPCRRQFVALQNTIIQNLLTCGGALQ